MKVSFSIKDKINIRKMKNEDISFVSKLWNQLAFNQMSRDAYFNGDPQLLLNLNQEDYLSKCHCDPKCCIFIVEYENQIIGFAELWFREKDFLFNIENYIYITRFFIDKNIEIKINPLYIPIKLFKACEKKTMEFGCNYVCADVFKFNKEMQILLKLCHVFPDKIRYVKRLKNGE